MRPLRCAVFAVALLVATGGVASADWQFTRWGMTPDQVARASDGRARRIPPGDAKEWTRGDHIAVLSMPYSEGRFAFTARFLFEAGRLSVVQLALLDPSKAHALVNSIASYYGAAQRVEKAVWVDRKNRNRISYVAIEELVSLLYSPLDD